MQIWFQEDFRNFWDACPWEEDLGYARQVCEFKSNHIIASSISPGVGDEGNEQSAAEQAD
jgi:hypothetical protein